MKSIATILLMVTAIGSTQGADRIVVIGNDRLQIGGTDTTLIGAEYVKQYQDSQSNWKAYQSQYQASYNQYAQIQDANIRAQKLANLQQQYQDQQAIYNAVILQLQQKAKAIAAEDARLEQEHQAKMASDAADEERKDQEHRAKMALDKQEYDRKKKAADLETSVAQQKIDAENQRSAAEAADRDSANALSGARQYRDAKEWVKADATYRSIIAKWKGTASAVTADIELTDMKKVPDAKAVLDALAAEQKSAADAATKEKNKTKAASQVSMVKEMIKNGANQTDVKKLLQKIIDLKSGGDAENEAKEILKTLEP